MRLVIAFPSMRLVIALLVSAALAVFAAAQPPRPAAPSIGPGFLTNLSVQEELKLTESQAKKFAEFSAKIRENQPKFDPGDTEKRSAWALKMLEESTKLAQETLTVEQYKRLREITLQRGGVLAVLRDEETAKAFKLTNEQKAKLTEISEALRKGMREMLQGDGLDAQKMAALRKDALIKSENVLTIEQKKTWDAMTGKPFEVTPPDGFKNYAELDKKYRQWVAAVGKETKFALYEGLPREGDSTKKTIKIQDYDFYEQTVSVKDADAKRLVELLRTKEFFSLRSGPSRKKCGGFHPDWCLEWKVGAETYRVLLCFGCYEANFYGPKFSVFSDLLGDAHEEFPKILAGYRKNRPAEE